MSVCVCTCVQQEREKEERDNEKREVKERKGNREGICIRIVLKPLTNLFLGQIPILQTPDLGQKAPSD